MRSVLIIFWLSSVALAYPPHPPKDGDSVLTLTDRYEECVLLSVSNMTTDTSFNFDEFEFTQGRRQGDMPPSYPVRLGKLIDKKSVQKVEQRERVAARSTCKKPGVLCS